MKSWCDIKAEFDTDGSLRDIYIENISPEIWEGFINNVKASEYRFEFSHGGEVIGLPSNLYQIKLLQETEPTTLRIWLNEEIQINCHFFEGSEIELDVSPKDITGEPEYQLLTSFLFWLHKTLNQRVILTHENAQDQVILSVG